MDKIELMENILSQYRGLQKLIKETEQDKQRGEMALNKEKERYYFYYRFVYYYWLAYLRISWVLWVSFYPR